MGVRSLHLRVGHTYVRPVVKPLYSVKTLAANPGDGLPQIGARAPGPIVWGMSDTPAESSEAPDFDSMTRDIAEVPAVEVIVTVAVNLMSAAAVKLGLTEEGDKYKDLDEARKLITALAGLLDASATEISSFHAAPLRDGLKSLQLAFREASLVPDEPGQGPGEKYTGPVYG
ncbi:hypothetical protein GCM10017771_63720 [Streptomyces capitiformicae]|uniref:DUF1844 domain-containing protein n=2 Tax=Streptomyces capitiformicae TaxID=2014920 RepID=A0A918ZBY0_9ACTN|nr:hypothetical protein GCM10017771_63720 [Streptomyces capitiformicae]